VIFLAEIGIIDAATGTVKMAQLAERRSQLPANVQMIRRVMHLLGSSIKAASFPQSFLLPDSYQTARASVTAVSARLLTMVGIYSAIAQSEIKRIVSFTLVSHIGYMLFGVALGTNVGLSAAIYYTVHHIIVQTALFLAIGLVEMRGGSTSTRSLGGLMVLSPV